MDTRKLLAAIKCGSLAEVKDIILAQPAFDINANICQGVNCLHIACEYDAGEIVSWLLKQPGIDVNRQTKIHPITALALACRVHSTTALKPLLDDPRTRVDILEYGHSFAWVAVYSAPTWFVRHLIASDRDLDWDTKGRHWNGEEYTPLELARRRNKGSLTTSLLELVVTHPAAARHQARISLQFPMAVAADLFSCIVFISDHLLLEKEFPLPATAESTDSALWRWRHNKSARFFRIAARLPLDLQGLLCLRSVGSGRPFIRTDDLKIAFQSLAVELSTRPMIF